MTIAIICTFWAIFWVALEAGKVLSGTDHGVQERLATLMRPSASAETANLMPLASESPAARRLRLRLSRLGLNRRSDFDRALNLRRLSYLMPVLALALLFFMGFPLPQVLLGTLLFSIIFVLTPNLIMMRFAIRRRQELARHLPDTLDLMILCLEAGHSFHVSLVKVAEEQQRISSHISRELKLTNQEILAGKSQKQALDHLAQRTQIEEMRTIVAAINQSVKLGTSLVKTLRTQANVSRKRRREKIRELILKTPVKLIFPLLFFIFPSLLILVLAPSFMNIFRNLSAVGY